MPKMQHGLVGMRGISMSTFNVLKCVSLSLHYLTYSVEE